jgi:Uma2 family endonuclease
MSIVSTIKMTARQFTALGEDPAGVRLELVNGEIAVSPSPTPVHSFIEKQLSGFLWSHIRAHDLGILLGDVDTIFGEHDVRRPDILFFAKARCHLIKEKRLDGPPDLAVEIISPSSGTIDRVDKFEQYQAGGVQHYWMLDPAARSLESYALRRGKYVESGKGSGNDVLHLPPFADLELQLAQLWFATSKRGGPGRDRNEK